MLCSSCSVSVRPIVAVDIDGTLGDYHRHLLDFAQGYLGAEVIGDYHGEENFGDWFCRRFGCDRSTYRQVKLAYRQGGQKRTMPVYHGARGLLETISSAAEVWLTTTRPYLRLDGIDPDTRAWLSRHGLTYDGLLYDEDKYQVLASRVDPKRVVAVLDDLPEQYDAAERAFGENVPILRRTRWNDMAHRPMEVNALDSALAIIMTRISGWEDYYGGHRQDRHAHGAY